jgi:hypothetical protein
MGTSFCGMERRDITWEIEAIRAMDALAQVAHLVSVPPPRPKCWIVDAREFKAKRKQRLALPPPRD